MSASRDALIDVLAQRQFTDDGAVRCTCGVQLMDTSPSIDDNRWLAEHQADAAIAAGISPFRVDHVDAS